ncbi:YagK/YfjJ domain-containing protein [Acinetobacter soli]|uniref:YagK/YfjJ domain-containing protein n=1 Tax=Acinetobacter soli TaxID=487316 RepID=UPI001250529D|nr:inovirus-type Gp2 protein [Acinetobacter soli]
MFNPVNESRILIEIENFVEDILARKYKSRKFYNDLTNLLMDFDTIYNSDFHYSALIGAFIELLLDMEEYLYCQKQLLNRLSEISYADIKRDFKKHDRQYQRQLRDHRYSESQNTKQLIERMKKVSDEYARILVVRVDLGYPLKHHNQVGVQEFNDDMMNLRKKIHDRDNVFKGLIEYAWALEQGIDKGYHCHLLLVYKGHERHKAYGIADQVGKLWKQITGDLGCYFNCHATEYLRQFSERNMLGIGMIYRNDSEQVRQMLRTVSYLVNPEKQDQYLRVKCSKRMHSFG